MTAETIRRPRTTRTATKKSAAPHSPYNDAGTQYTVYALHQTRVYYRRYAIIDGSTSYPLSCHLTRPYIISCDLTSMRDLPVPLVTRGLISCFVV